MLGTVLMQSFSHASGGALAIEWGPDGAFFPLTQRCFHLSPGDGHTYTFCPFREVGANSLRPALTGR
jgi:hypothetical protein